MDAILNPAVSELLKLGLPGVVIIGLSIALWLERQGNRKLWEARVTDVRACSTALSESTEATKGHTDALKTLTEVLRVR
jgi:hypothetical protein